MRCLAVGQIAAAAADEANPALRAHVAECDACKRAVDEQRELRGMLAGLPPAPLPRDRRAMLAAEVMARADELPLQRSSRLRAGLGIAAAAAILVVMLAARDRNPDANQVALAPPLTEAPAQRFADDRAYERTESDPQLADTLAPVSGPRADFARSLVRGRDTVVLRDGEIMIDARSARPVEIDGGKTGVRVTGAKVAVMSRAGVIETVTVFAGSVEVTREGRRQVIDAGAVWHPELRDTASLEAFRIGWQALRAGRNTDAIGAFDMATDPVVAEDAAYWAAVAAERAGDRADAKRRLADFLVRFPASPRIETARSAHERLLAP